MPSSAHRLTALFTLLVALLITGAGHAGLQQDVEALVRRTDLGDARIGVSIVDTATGATLVRLNDDDAFIPASNLKLLTTGAALHTLGHDFRFETKLLRRGDQLVVLGSGDPAFGDPDLLNLMTMGDGQPMGVEALLGVWVQAVQHEGMESVSSLIIDDRVFDRQFVHPTWPTDQLNRTYCAQVSGLSFHLNILTFYPKPSSGQRPIIGASTPAAPWLTIRNRASSQTEPGKSDTVWIARKLGGNDLTFYGNVKHPYRTPRLHVTIDDPPAFFAKLLADRLDDAGVTVEAARSALPQDPEPDGDPIGPIIYTPIETVITRCNRDSENLYAEALLKRMGFQLTGQPGSWLNGSSIIRHAVHERLDDPSISTRLVIADGSGLSRDNRITPHLMTAWLHSLNEDDQLRDMFIESLSVGGANGTLRKRFRSNDMNGAVVQAKSGYINNVSCLSGFVTTPDGRRCCFSVLVNDLHVPVSRAKQLQDNIVKTIARSMAPHAASAAGSE
jgi:D-alanyl-D-alanine carboxypeptidase/D-alanyl-D-alanine-endopeptidase (penicillin-binding protein 4)